MEVDDDSPIVDLSLRKPAPVEVSHGTDGPQDLSVQRPAPRGGHERRTMTPQSTLVKGTVSREEEDDFKVNDRDLTAEELDRKVRRSSRQKLEKCYAEVASDEEVHVNGYSNGYGNSSDVDMNGDEMDEDDYAQLPFPPTPPELSDEERREKTLLIQRLQEELRNEEMKLVLLRKIRQTQLLAAQQQQQQQQQQYHHTSNLTTNDRESKQPLPAHSTPPPQQQQPLAAHTKSGSTAKGNSGSLLPRSTSQSARSSSNSVPSGARSSNSSSSSSAAHASHRGTTILPHSRQPITTPPNVVLGMPIGSAAANAPSSPGVQINDKRDPLRNTTSPSVAANSSSSAAPAAHQGTANSRPAEDPQSAAQRQAVAKLALRKQLEKTLLQIPPPKPPPPEMHFIPNPNNTEFIYLLGLEAIVDRMTSDGTAPPPPIPFVCSQCSTDFSSLWKWDKAATLEKPAVMCDQCVTNNVKKALKAEHTNRLKTAFVRALQQEQEIEQRLAQGGNISPAPPLSVSTSVSTSNSGTATSYDTLPPIFSKNNTPAPAHSPSVNTLPVRDRLEREREREREREMRERERELRERERERERDRSESREREKERERAAAAAAAAALGAAGSQFDLAALSKLSDPTKLFGGHPMSTAAAAAAAAALQAQLLRAGMGLHSGASLQGHGHNPLLNPFSPLLYPYQLAMAASAAQAAAQGGKGSSSGGNSSSSSAAFTAASLAELQRQYLLDMLPHLPNLSGSGGSSSRSSQGHGHNSEGRSNWK